MGLLFTTFKLVSHSLWMEMQFLEHRDQELRAPPDLLPRLLGPCLLAGPSKARLQEGLWSDPAWPPRTGSPAICRGKAWSFLSWPLILVRFWIFAYIAVKM